MTKKHRLSLYFVVALVAASVASSQAQTVIGMGTEQPNPNAVLELVPEQGNQGFLAPRLTTAQRQSTSFTSRLSRADHGLLVFDTNEGQFYYWFNGAWRPGTSGGTGGPNAEVSGTTWYTGTTAPSGVNAAEGDFYINESTGEVFKFSGNAFVTMGNIQGGAANSQTLSSVLQQGGSAGNQKVTDLGAPTEDNDAATKGYVDTELANVSALNPNLKAVLDQGNSADGSKITNLAPPTDNADAANKQYVDSRETATRAYIDQEILTFPGSTTPSLGQVLGEDNNANNTRITNLADPTNTQDAATKFYVDDNDNDNQSLDNVLSEGNDANNEKIIGLKDPDDPQDAATKAYVDSEITSASLPSGNIPSLQQVLTENNSAANQQITNLAAPSAAHHAANRKYVDDRDLENILDRDNDAGGRQITDLGSPTADGHATNRKYVDDQDNAVSVNSKITDFSFNSGNNKLNLTEGGVPYTVDLGTLNNGTPAALPEGNIFVGDNSSSPQAVTITGDISIDAAGLVTIKNARITTAKIANSAVTKEKINADVAGPGLAKDTNVDGLRVNTGNGLTIDSDSDEVKISPFPEGWIGIGQGLGVDMNFKKVDRDGSLNEDGELTVKGLQGRTVANTAPSDKEVLQWDNDAKEWAPASLPPGGGGLPALPNGRLFIGNNGNQPTPTTISGDITIAANGTATIGADVVDRTKINADVAGTGLSQAGDGRLQVSLGGDVTTAGSNLTVTKLQGNQVATTAPTANGQVLTWNGSQWAPTAGGGGAQVSTGSGNPNGGAGSKGDIYVKDDGTIFIKTKANSNPDSWSPIPKTLSGNGEPGPGQGNQGDTYVRTDGDGEVYIKGASGWVEVD